MNRVFDSKLLKFFFFPFSLSLFFFLKIFFDSDIIRKWNRQSMYIQLPHYPCSLSGCFLFFFSSVAPTQWGQFLFRTKKI